MLYSYKYLQELMRKNSRIKPNYFSATNDLSFAWSFLPLGRYKCLNIPLGSKSVTTLEIVGSSRVPQIRTGLLRSRACSAAHVMLCLLTAQADTCNSHSQAERLVSEPTVFLCWSLQTLLSQCVPLLPVQLHSVFWVQSETIPHSGTSREQDSAKHRERHWGHEHIIRKNLSAPSSPAAN